jgi:peptidoglycan/LPS O-acetylase OafA/YrhL
MKYVKSFDGLRGISIIFVLLNHLGITLLLPQRNFIMQRVWPLFAGVTGVNIFFAISGFLITSILLKEMNGSGISLKRFYIRRALRLLPALFIFYAIIVVLLLTRTIEGSWESFLYSFFYLYNFAPPRIYIPECIHTWSLAVEEQFYFTWPFVLLLFKQKKAFNIGIGLIGLCLIAKFILPVMKLTVNGQSIAFGDYFRTDLWFIPAVAPIIIGSMTAIAIFNNPRRAENIFVYYRQLLVVAFVLFISPLYLAPFLLDFAYILQALGISLLLGILLYQREIIVSRILGFGPLVYIGKISYGIYVFQGLFLRNGPGGKLLINKFPLDLFLTLIIAILSYHLVERPILRYKEKFR